jgi:proteasome activator subunit 4
MKWKYVEIATSFLYEILRRDLPLSNDVAKFLMDRTTSPQPKIRINAQRFVRSTSRLNGRLFIFENSAIVKLLKVVKIQTYSQTFEEMWLEDWQCPLSTYQPIKDISAFSGSLSRPLEGNE